MILLIIPTMTQTESKYNTMLHNTVDSTFLFIEAKWALTQCLLGLVWLPLLCEKDGAIVAFFLFVTFTDRISRYSRGLDSMQFDNDRVACLLFIEDGFIQLWAVWNGRGPAPPGSQLLKFSSLVTMPPAGASSADIKCNRLHLWPRWELDGLHFSLCFWRPFGGHENTRLWL